MIRRYVSLIVTALLVGAAGLAFHRVFGLGPIAPVVAVATLVPTALSAALSGPRGAFRRRSSGEKAAEEKPSGRKPPRCWPLWISVLLTAVAWLGVVSVTVLRPALSAGTLPDALRAGLRDSWKSILTTLLPAPAKPELLVLVHVVVWLAAFASAELALRTGLRAVPALPALAVFGVALLLGVDGPGSNIPLTAAVVVLTVALVLVRSGGADSGSGLRPLLLGVPSAAALGALAFLAGPYTPVSGEPYDPREQVQAPPPQQRDSVSPLDRVGGWLLSPDQALFTVRSSRPERWRLATLDRFDGVTWSSSARFVPTGSRVPEGPDAGRRRSVSQQVTLKELPGIWVPAADRPRTVKDVGVVVDPSSGSLAATRPLRPGQTYRVTSEVLSWSADDLAAATPAQDAEARAALALPWGPGAKKEPVQLGEFRELARQATRDAASPIQRALKLTEFLKKYARYDVTAAPGHSYRQLDYFLGQGRRGTPEHFATAYALLARTLGLPTRVTVGFNPGQDAGGVREVRARDVIVRPEIKFERLGWVPFNPTPGRAGQSKDSDSVAAGETEQALEKVEKNAASQRRGSGPGKTNQLPPPRPKSAPEEGFTLPWWVYPLGAGALAVVAYLLAVLIVPGLRRRRRRSGTPAAAITGAWHQALEHLSDLGLSAARTLTAHEVAGFGVRAMGEAARRHLQPLADLVNHTRFSSGGADPHAAREAWRHTDQVGRLVTAKAGRLRRLRRRLHPRSLSSRPRL